MAYESENTSDRPDEQNSSSESPEGVAKYWLQEIQFGERKLKWFRKRGDQIIKRYRNKRSTATPAVTNIQVGQRRMNILWSNTQILKPTLYSQTPKPNVSRRNKDKNPVGRWAAIVLERVLANLIDMQEFDYVMEQDIENLCLTGFGCSMIEYVPEIETDEQGNENIKWQSANLRYINWRDQVTNPCRFLQEKTWWAYPSYLTRREVAKAYSPEIASEIQLDHKPEKDTDDTRAKATVWCVWDKTSTKIYHVAPGYPKAPLGTYDPPVRFPDFFPTPRPLMATVAPDSTVPTPDFDQYQDQADEIDLLTQRIYVLTRSLKLRGLYPGDMQSIRQLMDEGTDADLIPVEQWAMIGERGGADNIVIWFPIEQVAKTLEWCHEAREKALATVDQILGISDIMRGETEPQETAKAQQIKGQYGSIRIRDRQKDVQRYVRDLLRLMSCVVGQHFTLDVLQKMSGANLLTQDQKQTIQQYQQLMAQRQQQWGQMAQRAAQMIPPQQPPPPPQPIQPAPTKDMLKAMEEPTWEEVIQLLRDDHARGFVIDIETDSTIEPDQMAEQLKATQFLTAVSQFVEAWLPVIANAPMMADLAGELLMKGVRAYKAGETIETQVETAVEALKKMAQQPKPDPKAMESQAKVAVAETQMQTAQVKAQAEQTKARAEIIQTGVDHHVAMREKAADVAMAQQGLHPEQLKAQSAQPPVLPQ